MYEYVYVKYTVYIYKNIVWMIVGDEDETLHFFGRKFPISSKQTAKTTSWKCSSSIVSSFFVVFQGRFLFFFFGMSEWQCLLDVKKWVLWLSFRSFDSLFSGQIDNSIHHLVEFIKHEPQTFVPRKVPSGWVGGLATKYHAGYTLED